MKTIKNIILFSLVVYFLAIFTTNIEEPSAMASTEAMVNEENSFGQIEKLIQFTDLSTEEVSELKNWVKSEDISQSFESFATILGNMDRKNLEEINDLIDKYLREN